MASFESPWLSKVSPGEQVPCLQFWLLQISVRIEQLSPTWRHNWGTSNSNQESLRKLKASPFFVRQRQRDISTYFYICPYFRILPLVFSHFTHHCSLPAFPGPCGFRASPGNSASSVWQENWSTFPAALIRKQCVKQDQTSSPFLEDLLQFPQCSQRQC